MRPPVIRFKLLAFTLALGYIALVVYVSLVPFEGWGDFSELKIIQPFWKRSPDPYRTVADIIFNIVAYIPVSTLIFFGLPLQSIWIRATLAFITASSLSFSMEFIQQIIPGRIASWFDWLVNSLGAALGLIVVRKAKQNNLVFNTVRSYNLLFHSTSMYVVGETFLVIWLMAQSNPAISAFSLIYQRPTPSDDIIRIWIETIQIAFECVGASLFFSILLRPHKWNWLPILLFILGIIGLKYLWAFALLHHEFPVTYPHQWLGIGIGITWIAILLWLPPFQRRIAAGVALLSSIGVTFLGKDLWHSDIPFELFNWRYGQLVHFNELTHSTLWITTIGMILQLAFLQDKSSMNEKEKIK